LGVTFDRDEFFLGGVTIVIIERTKKKKFSIRLAATTLKKKFLASDPKKNSMLRSENFATLPYILELFYRKFLLSKFPKCMENPTPELTVTYYFFSGQGPEIFFSKLLQRPDPRPRHDFVTLGRRQGSKSFFHFQVTP